MTSAKIIPFPNRSEEPEHPDVQSTFDYAAYERRAAARYRRSAICGWISSISEAIVTVAIGVCVLLGTAVFLTTL